MSNLGAITLNEIQIFEVDADPSLEGLAASVGSLAILINSPKMFLKYGEGDTEWNAVSPDSKYLYYTKNDISTSSNNYSNISDLITDSLIPGLYKFDFNAEFVSNSGVNDIKSRVIADTATMTIVQGEGSVTQKDSTTFTYSIYGFLEIISIGSLAIQIKSNTSGNSIALNKYALFTLEKL